MSTRRVVIGKRQNGTYGIFVSPVGFDAFTAADANLILNIQSKVSQLILMGHVASTQVIALGLSARPKVIVTSKNNLSSIPGYVGTGGPVRPSPLAANLATTSNVVINGGGASMTVNCSGDTFYAVYGITF